uniref:Uncharacterized protein n=1 Tax=Neospora caninum (strain Liverpool) TaxID=572307 RepID=A0A0F7U4S3_NEOCL|nr:TPA: hypothetical protein BN1204_006437 [Neospora caninum Liverpool]
MGVGFGNGQVKIYGLEESLLSELCGSSEEAVDTQGSPDASEAVRLERGDGKAPASTANEADDSLAEPPGGETRQGRNDPGRIMVELMSSKESREAVTHICFSEDCCHVAVAQADRCICLYKLGYRMGDTSLPLEWIFSGLIISSATVIEQQAVPKGCLAIQPEEGSADVHVLVYTSDFKMKIWSANSRSCIRTTLAPTHGGVLNSVADVSYRHKKARRQRDCSQGEDNGQSPEEEETEQQFLVFSCGERLIGMIQKPLDGNPYKAISMVAHPKEIPATALERLKTKPSKEFFFTCGGTDFTICQWKLNPSVVMANVQRGGDGTQPFNQLIPGGVEGEFYRSMKDYFYYCQIRSEGERTTKSRKLDGTVPLTELANLLCAVGECPSHMDIQNLVTECESIPVENRPASAVDIQRTTGETARKVSFEQFLQLYVNHRAVISAGYEEVVSALRVLKKKNHNTPLTPEFLFQTLSKTLCGTTSLVDFLGSPFIDEDAFARKVLLLEPISELCEDCEGGEKS